MSCAEPNKRLHIFESALDAISHATIDNLIKGYPGADVWRKDNRLSLGGVTDKALGSYLEAHGWVEELIFCTDNDAPGREAATAMARKYADKGYRTRLELPVHKDYNDDLRDLRVKMSRGYRPYNDGSRGSVAVEGYAPYAEARGWAQ